MHVGLGERAEALDRLEEAHAERAADLAWLGVRPVFASLRAEPGFTALLTQMGFAGPRAAPRSEDGREVLTKLLVMTLVLLTQALPAASQQPAAEVRGSVADPVGSPLEGIVVSLMGGAGTRTAVTDQSGLFRIDGIPPGSYQLHAKGEHHYESTQSVVLKPGAVLNVNFELQPEFVYTRIVTATRSGEHSLISAPAAVSFVGSEQIEASAAENVPDLLRGVPGLNFTQFNARDLDINARSSTGILSNSMLVMVDGRSFFQPLYGAVYWDLMTVTKDEISQIEVLRSPASAIWGANALNGVVNIRTKSPRQMTGLRGDLAFGERGTKSADMTWADARPTLSYKLSASYFEQDPWERDNRLPGRQSDAGRGHLRESWDQTAEVRRARGLGRRPKSRVVLTRRRGRSQRPDPIGAWPGRVRAWLVFQLR